MCGPLSIHAISYIYSFTLFRYYKRRYYNTFSDRKKSQLLIGTVLEVFAHFIRTVEPRLASSKQRGHT